MSEPPANLYPGSGYADPDPHDALRRRAEQLLELGRPAEALITTSAGLASDPEDFGLLCLHCAALGRLDRDKEAMHAAEALIRLAPDLDTGHHLYAAYRWDAGHRDARALQSARRAAELDPHDPANLLLLSHMLVYKRRPKEARERLGAALALDPSPGQRATALALLGQLALHARRPAEALRQAQAALAERPDHDAAMRVLAAAQLRGPQPHEAIRTAWSAVQQDPADRHKAEYLRAMVHGHLPHPLGLRTWSLVFVPYGIGIVVSLLLALATWLGNLRRFAALPPDLREVVRGVRPPVDPALRRKLWLWLPYWGLFLGGLLLIPKADVALQNGFFWSMATLGLGLWLWQRRDPWLAFWWVYWLVLVAAVIVLPAAPLAFPVVYPVTLSSLLGGGLGLWVWRWRRRRRR